MGPSTCSINLLECILHLWKNVPRWRIVLINASQHYFIQRYSNLLRKNACIELSAWMIWPPWKMLEIMKQYSTTTVHASSMELRTQIPSTIGLIRSTVKSSFKDSPQHGTECQAVPGQQSEIEWLYWSLITDRIQWEQNAWHHSREKSMRSTRTENKYIVAGKIQCKEQSKEHSIHTTNQRHWVKYM